MQYSHSTPDHCEYEEIARLLKGSGYFKYSKKPSCRCSSRSPTYTSEWDYEHREYFGTYSKGTSDLAGFLTNILSLDLRRKLPDFFENIRDMLEGIPRRERRRIADLIESAVLKIPPYVNRVSITCRGDYLGWIDLRPILFGRISEAHIRPPKWMRPPRYYVTCERSFIPEPSLRPRTEEIEKVECTPYVQYAGHGEIGACAQYAARLTLLILEGEHAPTVPELTFSAMKDVLRGGIERPREGGLMVGEIGGILGREGYSIFRYSRKLCPSCSYPLREIECSSCGRRFNISPITMEPSIENIYAYVESGLPVLLGVEKAKMLEWWGGEGDGAHALVVIGHTLSESDKVDGLIVHDVSKYPYKVLSDPHNGRRLEEIITEALVPVPMEVTTRYQIAREGILEIAELTGGEVYRPMLVEANKVKRWLGEGVNRPHFDVYDIPQGVQRVFSNAFLDRYVWLFEIKKDVSGGRREYKGDVLYSGTREKVLGFNFPEKNVCGFIDENDELHEVKYSSFISS